MEPGQVVAVGLVVSIPGALARALRVHVVRIQRVRRFTADFERAAQARQLRRASVRRPGPVIAKKVEVKIVGQFRRHDRRQPGHQVVGFLRPRGRCRRLPERVARQHAADVHLIRRQLLIAVVAVADGEVVLLAEVMVQPHHAEVGNLRQLHGRYVPLGVVLVAERRVVRQRHLLAPNLVDGRVQPEAARIAERSAPAGCRLIRDAVSRHRRRVQIVGLINSRAVGNLDHARAQQRRWHILLYRSGVRITKALVVGEEVGLPTRERRQQRSAHCAAETVLVRLRQRRVQQSIGRRVVVLPCIGSAYVGGEEVVVERAMELIGSALGDHLDLAAGGAIEIGRLVGDSHLELLNALHRCREHARCRASVAGRIGRVGTRHVVAVVAAIELEGALIVLRSGHLSGRGHAYLQDGKRGRVAAQVRYQQQRIAGDRGANGRIHRLQLRSRRSRDFHRGRSGADFQHHVERERQPHIYGLRFDSGQPETGLRHREIVAAERHAVEYIPARLVGHGFPLGIGGIVDQFDHRSAQDGALRVGHQAGHGSGRGRLRTRRHRRGHQQ